MCIPNATEYRKKQNIFECEKNRAKKFYFKSQIIFCIFYYEYYFLFISMKKFFLEFLYVCLFFNLINIPKWIQ